jgi:ABC-type lipoprotein release transport system permease subunit
MPFSWFLAVRFLKEGRAQTGLILAGVAVGVGVIIFLSALISGLQTTLVKQTARVAGHIVVRPPEEAARVLSEGTLAVRREARPAARPDHRPVAAGARGDRGHARRDGRGGDGERLRLREAVASR